MPVKARQRMRSERSILLAAVDGGGVIVDEDGPWIVALRKTIGQLAQRLDTQIAPFTDEQLRRSWSDEIRQMLVRAVGPAHERLVGHHVARAELLAISAIQTEVEALKNGGAARWLYEFREELRAEGIPLAFVTDGTRRYWTDCGLLPWADDFFDSVTTGEEAPVGSRKNDGEPLLYELAMKKHGVTRRDAHRVIAVEDSGPAASSCTGAGVNVFVRKTAYTRDHCFPSSCVSLDEDVVPSLKLACEAFGLNVGSEARGPAVHAISTEVYGR